MVEREILLQLFAGGEKTEPATPKRRQEAREKGQVPRSHEIGGALTLLAIFAVLHYLIRSGGTSFFDFMRESLGTIGAGGGQLTVENLGGVLGRASRFFVDITAPLLVIALLIAFLTNFIQIGALWTAKPLTPKLDVLNPINGLRKILSRRALVELAKSTLKIAVVGWIAYGAVAGSMDTLSALGEMELDKALYAVEDILWRIGSRVGAAMLVLAGADYLYQRFEHEKSIRMSKEDLMEEMRQTEGDPKVRGRIKQKQRQLAARRMMAKAPEADVVITNPTHVAVALQYDANKMAAPIVIAKGAGYVAQRIREIAAGHGITIVENPGLAWALYDAVDVGAAIPGDLFKAVAEVLAFVYRLKRKE